MNRIPYLNSETSKLRQLADLTFHYGSEAVHNILRGMGYVRKDEIWRLGERQLILGIGDCAEGGVEFSREGQGAVFTTLPQRPFRPRKFVISEKLARDFLIDDFKIGKNSVFLSSLSVPGETFSHLAIGVSLGLDMCVVGQQITVMVTYLRNHSKKEKPVRFLGAVIGDAIP